PMSSEPALRFCLSDSESWRFSRASRSSAISRSMSTVERLRARPERRRSGSSRMRRRSITDKSGEAELFDHFAAAGVENFLGQRVAQVLFVAHRALHHAQDLLA